jgi:ABC-2 type transport system ATP-binding protein
MLEARNLTKIYPKACSPALDGLELRVSPGEVFCLLGPNGSGKTTTVNLFLNFITPTQGEARVGGISSFQNPIEARSKLAYIPEMVMLYGVLSAIDNLRYFAVIAGVELSDRQGEILLRQAGLQQDVIHRPVSSFSKGMRQKVGVAIALARKVEALLLDEPTSGLDPYAANEFSLLIEKLRNDGLAILMVTHDLFLAKQCGTRIGIMNQGRLSSVLDASTVDHVGLERVYLEQFQANAL